MKVIIENRQRVLPIDKKEIRRQANGFAELAKVELAVVIIIIVDDKRCAPINESAVGHQGATDVITLFYPTFPGDDEGASAEIIINAECAKKQKPEDPYHELAYYLAHSFNHLSGRDDDTPERRTAMHRREHRWLKIVAPGRE